MLLENVYYSEMKDAGFFDADWDWSVAAALYDHSHVNYAVFLLSVYWT